MPPADARGIVEFLLAAPGPAAPCADVAAWWPRHRALAERWPDPIERAIAGGAIADRIGWAFASGYQAALRALVPDLPPDRVAAFCVTEEGGNAPRDIRSTLERDGEHGWRLSGAKRWTTLGPDGALFLVAARDGTVSGERPSIRMVALEAGAPGLTIEPMPPTKFVPEVPHARLKFESVALPTSAILPGDGYARYVKPFRTVEDAHVHAAILAHALREALRFGWDRGWIERALATLLALRGIGRLAADAAATHLALAGALAQGEALLAEADVWWQEAPDAAARERWLRDRAIGKVALGARSMRTSRAWESFGAP